MVLGKISPYWHLLIFGLCSDSMDDGETVLSCYNEVVRLRRCSRSQWEIGVFGRSKFSFKLVLFVSGKYIPGSRDIQHETKTNPANTPKRYLGPLLFLVYINDIVDVVPERN